MAKNKNIFVTITGFQHYYGREPFQIGNLIRCAKEPGNPYDSDAIRAFLPYIGKVGYIANSPQTKAGGTESASRIYERMPKRFYVRVLFTTCTKIICRVEFGDMSDLNAELKRTSGATGTMKKTKSSFKVTFRSALSAFPLCQPR